MSANLSGLTQRAALGRHPTHTPLPPWWLVPGSVCGDLRLPHPRVWTVAVPARRHGHQWGVRKPREGTGGGQGGPSPRRTFRRARSLAGALGSACGAGGNTAGTARHAVCSVPASCADRALPKVTDAGAICGTRCGRQRAVADGRAGPTRYVAFGLRCVRPAPRAPSPTAVRGLRAAGRVAGGGIVRLPPASLPLPSHVRSRGHGFPVAAAPGRVLGVPAGPPYPRPGRHLRAETARVTQGGILV